MGGCFFFFPNKIQVHSSFICYNFINEHVNISKSQNS